MGKFAATNSAWNLLIVGRFVNEAFQWGEPLSLQGGLRTAYGALGVGLEWSDEINYVGAVNAYNFQSELLPYNYAVDQKPRADTNFQPFVGIHQPTFSMSSRLQVKFEKPLPAGHYQDIDPPDPAPPALPKPPYTYDNPNGNVTMRHRWSDWNPKTRRWLHLYAANDVQRATGEPWPNGLYIISTNADGTDPVQTYLSASNRFPGWASPRGSAVHVAPNGDVWVIASFGFNTSGERVYIAKLTPNAGNTFEVPVPTQLPQSVLSPYRFDALWIPQRIGGSAYRSNGLTVAFLVQENQTLQNQTLQYCVNSDDCNAQIAYPSDPPAKPQEPRGRGDVAGTKGARILLVNIGLPVPCERAAPTLTLSPTLKSGPVGVKQYYTPTITNNNSAACGPGNFDLSTILPPGFKVWNRETRLTIVPGARATSSLHLTSPTTSLPGRYAFSVKAVDAAAASKNATAAGIYEVLSQ